MLNVALFEPAGVVPTYHWYDGLLPPFVGVAVNVMVDPEQMVLLVASDEIVPLAGKDGFTVPLTATC